MKHFTSFLLLPVFVLVMLLSATSCRLAGKHADAKVINSEQPTILKDSTNKMADTSTAQPAGQ